MLEAGTDTFLAHLLDHHQNSCLRIKENQITCYSCRKSASVCVAVTSSGSRGEFLLQWSHLDGDLRVPSLSLSSICLLSWQSLQMGCCLLLIARSHTGSLCREETTATSTYADSNGSSVKNEFRQRINCISSSFLSFMWSFVSDLTWMWNDAFTGLSALLYIAAVHYFRFVMR